MKKWAALISVCFFVLGLTCVAFAQERGTAKEAMAVVDKAIAYYKANGKAKAFAEFNNKKGQFLKKDLTSLLLTGLERYWLMGQTKN